MNRDEHLLKKTTRAYYSTKKDILYVIHKTQLIKKYLSPPPPKVVNYRFMYSETNLCIIFCKVILIFKRTGMVKLVNINLVI